MVRSVCHPPLRLRSGQALRKRREGWGPGVDSANEIKSLRHPPGRSGCKLAEDFEHCRHDDRRLSGCECNGDISTATDSLSAPRGKNKAASRREQIHVLDNVSFWAYGVAHVVGAAFFVGSGEANSGPYFHPWGSCKHKVVCGRTRGFEEAS